MKHFLIFSVSESPLLSQCTESIFNKAMKYLKNKRKSSQLFVKAFVWNVQ